MLCCKGARYSAYTSRIKYFGLEGLIWQTALTKFSFLSPQLSSPAMSPLAMEVAMVAIFLAAASVEVLAAALVEVLAAASVEVLVVAVEVVMD